MHSGFLSHAILPTVGTRGGEMGIKLAAVPEAPDIVPRDNLGQTSCLDVSNFNRWAVEQEDIRRVERDVFRRALPLNGAKCATWVTMFVDVEAKF